MYSNKISNSLVYSANQMGQEEAVVEAEVFEAFILSPKTVLSPKTASAIFTSTGTPSIVNERTPATRRLLKIVSIPIKPELSSDQYYRDCQDLEIKKEVVGFSIKNEGKWEHICSNIPGTIDFIIEQILGIENLAASKKEYAQRSFKILVELSLTTKGVFEQLRKSLESLKLLSANEEVVSAMLQLLIATAIWLNPSQGINNISWQQEVALPLSKKNSNIVALSQLISQNKYGEGDMFFKKSLICKNLFNLK